ncbi:MAG: DsbA family protein [Myxococcales bacterium]|nr:DsbA family protein [Myxococcales bacterium]
MGVEIDFRPALLPIIKEPPPNPLPDGIKPPGLGPRKRANAANDLHHWAELCGAEFSPAARKLHKDPRLLTQAALVAGDEGRFREFHYPAFRARWAEARDISDPELVRSLLAGAGLDADPALERAQSDELRERLDADSRAAVERGVFGAPTLFVGDEMFWGNDRFELVRYYLEKARS